MPTYRVVRNNIIYEIDHDGDYEGAKKKLEELVKRGKAPKPVGFHIPKPPSKTESPFKAYPDPSKRPLPYEGHLQLLNILSGGVVPETEDIAPTRETREAVRNVLEQDIRKQLFMLEKANIKPPHSIAPYRPDTPENVKRFVIEKRWPRPNVMAKWFPGSFPPGEDVARVAWEDAYTAWRGAQPVDRKLQERLGPLAQIPAIYNLMVNEQNTFAGRASQFVLEQLTPEELILNLYIGKGLHALTSRVGPKTAAKIAAPLGMGFAAPLVYKGAQDVQKGNVGGGLFDIAAGTTIAALPFAAPKAFDALAKKPVRYEKLKPVTERTTRQVLVDAEGVVYYTNKIDTNGQLFASEVGPTGKLGRSKPVSENMRVVADTASVEAKAKELGKTPLQIARMAAEAQYARQSPKIWRPEDAIQEQTTAEGLLRDKGVRGESQLRGMGEEDRLRPLAGENRFIPVEEPKLPESPFKTITHDKYWSAERSVASAAKASRNMEEAKQAIGKNILDVVHSIQPDPVKANSLLQTLTSPTFVEKIVTASQAFGTHPIVSKIPKDALPFVAGALKITENNLKAIGHVILNTYQSVPNIAKYTTSAARRLATNVVVAVHGKDARLAASFMARYIKPNMTDEQIDEVVSTVYKILTTKKAGQTELGNFLQDSAAALKQSILDQNRTNPRLTPKTKNALFDFVDAIHAQYESPIGHAALVNMVSDSYQKVIGRRIPKSFYDAVDGYVRNNLQTSQPTILIDDVDVPVSGRNALARAIFQMIDFPVSPSGKSGTHPQIISRINSILKNEPDLPEKALSKSMASKPLTMTEKMGLAAGYVRASTNLAEFIRRINNSATVTPEHREEFQKLVNELMRWNDANKLQGARWSLEGHIRQAAFDPSDLITLRLIQASEEKGLPLTPEEMEQIIQLTRREISVTQSISENTKNKKEKLLNSEYAARLERMSQFIEREIDIRVAQKRLQNIWQRPIDTGGPDRLSAVPVDLVAQAVYDLSIRLARSAPLVARLVNLTTRQKIDLLIQHFKDYYPHLELQIGEHITEDTIIRIMEIGPEKVSPIVARTIARETVAAQTRLELFDAITSVNERLIKIAAHVPVDDIDQKTVLDTLRRLKNDISRNDELKSLIREKTGPERQQVIADYLTAKGRNSEFIKKVMSLDADYIDDLVEVGLDKFDKNKFIDRWRARHEEVLAKSPQKEEAILDIPEPLAPEDTRIAVGMFKSFSDFVLKNPDYFERSKWSSPEDLEEALRNYIKNVSKSNPARKDKMLELLDKYGVNQFMKFGGIDNFNSRDFSKYQTTLSFKRAARRIEMADIDTTALPTENVPIERLMKAEDAINQYKQQIDDLTVRLAEQEKVAKDAREQLERILSGQDNIQDASRKPSEAEPTEIRETEIKQPADNVETAMTAARDGESAEDILQLLLPPNVTVEDVHLFAPKAVRLLNALVRVARTINSPDETTGYPARPFKMPDLTRNDFSDFGDYINYALRKMLGDLHSALADLGDAQRAIQMMLAGQKLPETPETRSLFKQATALFKAQAERLNKWAAENEELRRLVEKEGGPAARPEDDLAGRRKAELEDRKRLAEALAQMVSRGASDEEIAIADSWYRVYDEARKTNIAYRSMERSVRKTEQIEKLIVEIEQRLAEGKDVTDLVKRIPEGRRELMEIEIMARQKYAEAMSRLRELTRPIVQEIRERPGSEYRQKLRDELMETARKYDPNNPIDDDGAKAIIEHLFGGPVDFDAIPTEAIRLLKNIVRAASMFDHPGAEGFVRKSGKKAKGPEQDVIEQLTLMYRELRNALIDMGDAQRYMHMIGNPEALAEEQVVEKSMFAKMVRLFKTQAKRLARMSAENAEFQRLVENAGGPAKRPNRPTPEKSVEQIDRENIAAFIASTAEKLGENADKEIQLARNWYDIYDSARNAHQSYIRMEKYLERAEKIEAEVENIKARLAAGESLADILKDTPTPDKPSRIILDVEAAAKERMDEALKALDELKLPYTQEVASNKRIENLKTKIAEIKRALEDPNYVLPETKKLSSYVTDEERQLRREYMRLRGQYEMLKRNMQPEPVLDWLTRFRMTNMLSSLGVHSLNFFATAFNLTRIEAERIAEALLVGDVTATQARAIGAMHGVKEGIQHAMKIISTGFVPSHLPEGIIPPRSFRGGLANPYNWIARIMRANDAFFYSIAKNAELYYLAKKMAKNPAQLYELIKHTPKALDEISDNHALEVCFRLDPYGNNLATNISKKIDILFSKNDAMRYVYTTFLPFTRIALEITRQGVNLVPGVRIGQYLIHRDDTMLPRTAVETLIGTMLATYGAIAYYNGDVTFGYQSGEIKKSNWAAEKRQPYSIVINDRSVSMQYLGPAAFPIIIGAALAEGYERTKKAPSQATIEKLSTIMRNGLVGQAKSFGQFSPISSLSPVIAAFGGETADKLPSVITNVARQYIPFSGFQSSLARAIDETARHPDNELLPGIWERILVTTPGLSYNVKPRQRSTKGAETFGERIADQIFRMPKVNKYGFIPELVPPSSPVPIIKKRPKAPKDPLNVSPNISIPKVNVDIGL